MTLRDSSGEITEKLGFSVVAAISVTQPFSTAGRSASCWLLLKRCTSSMNSTVPRPCMARLSRARSMTARTSLTPAVTAESSTKARPLPAESSEASVVLPVPGGPHRMTETTGESACAVISVRKRDPGASARSCPTTSSRVRGRMRTARGADELSASLEEARHVALERLVEHAQAQGANAVVGLRFDSTDMGATQGMAEILAYGTAVVLA